MLCFFGWTLRLRSEKKLFGTNGKESTETILLVWWWEASESLGLKNKQLLETHLIAATLRDMEGSSLTCWNETQCYWRREVAATWRLTLFFFQRCFYHRAKANRFDGSFIPEEAPQGLRKNKKGCQSLNFHIILSYKYCNYCTTSNLYVSWKILERATVQTNSCIFTLSHKHLLEAKTSNKRFQKMQIRPADPA